MNHSVVDRFAGGGASSGTSQPGYPSIRFRDMCASDLDAVLDVERACYDFPWTARVFQDCLNAGYICRLLEQMSQRDSKQQRGNKLKNPSVEYKEAKLLGHGILMLGPGEAHILNLCIVPAFQGTGLSVKLLKSLLDTAKANRAEEIFLEVRESNSAARKLYESNGFNQLAVRKNYYDAANGREDAWVYALTLADHLVEP